MQSKIQSILNKALIVRKGLMPNIENRTGGGYVVNFNSISKEGKALLLDQKALVKILLKAGASKAVPYFGFSDMYLRVKIYF